jgi:ABC-type glycerol-3-phosphate transport system substrate-binding protein
MPMHLKQWMSRIGGVILLLSLAIAPVIGQPEITITVAINSSEQDQYPDELFDTFEAQHPGVQVVTSVLELLYMGLEKHQDTGSLGEAFEGVQDALAKADVIVVDSNNDAFSIEATRAGLYLDLTPFITADRDFNQNDFPYAVWQSVNWDQGVWAIPRSFSLQVLMFDSKKFEGAGVQFPDPTWTRTDFTKAVHQLATYDSEGKVSSPGYLTINSTALFISLLGDTLVDSDHQPRLNTPTIQALVNEWNRLRQAGLLRFYGEFSELEVPMKADHIGMVGIPESETLIWSGALLPGGRAGLNVYGFAIPTTTGHPKIAYELIKFLSQSPVVDEKSIGTRPARLSMSVDYEQTHFSYHPNLDEFVALYDMALENAIPVSQTHFFNYLEPLLYLPVEDLEGIPNLDQVQQKALDTLNFAQKWGKQNQ